MHITNRKLQDLHIRNANQFRSHKINNTSFFYISYESIYSFDSRIMTIHSKVLYFLAILHLSQKLNNDFSRISRQIGDAQRKHSAKSCILSALP